MAKGNKVGSFFKGNWKMIACGVVAVIATIMSATALVKISRQETTYEIGWTSYQVAGVTADGKIDTEDTSSMTSAHFDCTKGFKITKNQTAVQYRVHFYDENKQFIQSSEVLTADYEYAVDQVANAKYARVELTPNNDEDGKVTVFELAGYADYLDIIVNK